MTEPEKITHEINESRLLCAVCHDCKERPQIHYDPGSTITTCGCGEFDRLPDWQPRNAMKIFNACWMTKDMSAKNIDRHKSRILNDVKEYAPAFR